MIVNLGRYRFRRYDSRNRVLWIAEHELLDEDAEVDLAGAIREHHAIVDGLKGTFEVEMEETDGQ